MLRLDLKDTGTNIADLADHELIGGYTSGQSYSVQQSPNTSGVIYSEDIEGNAPFSTAHSLSLGTWGHAMQFVTEPVFQGSKVVRFEIRDTDELVSDGYRAEVVIIKGDELPSIDMWYSYAIYFPSDGFGFDTERDMINQWYQDSSPATSLRIKNDRFLLESGNQSGKQDNRTTTDMGEVTKDVWHRFVFHFIHSYGSNGLIEVWHNGVKILTRHGGNMYNNGIMPKWKIGVYKSAFKYGTSLVHHRVVYYDNIRVGNQNASFGTMDPAAPLTTTTTTEMQAADIPQSSTQDTGMQLINQANGPASAVELYPTLVKRGADLMIMANTGEVLQALITDSSGRVVLSSEINGNTAIETDNMPSGLYFARIWSSSTAKAHKLVVTDYKFIITD